MLTKAASDTAEYRSRKVVAHRLRQATHAACHELFDRPLPWQMASEKYSEPLRTMAVGNLDGLEIEIMGVLAIQFQCEQDCSGSPFSKTS